MRDFFDEMNGADGATRAAYAEIAAWLAETPPHTLEAKRQEAERLFRRIGITFAVYTEGGDTERLIPFDIIPRVIDATETGTFRRTTDLKPGLLLRRAYVQEEGIGAQGGMDRL